ncbi:alanyl-tRNA synthetase [Microbacterium ginsengiterrae]|uniref:Alanyl-tRNA synthetase n=1 Tax=Microbacterium ginsengiterrae TaxID=546115 RepID=A0A7W9CDY9_9MICO|nr:hypothetical protein [Microbacterium ginsengiterrae]MBB5743870.1 alanyl-tRNA synthetase [Microbacterium ginsengiterrae]
MSATVVTFASGEVHAESLVSAVHAHPEGAVVVVERTPFHPVDHTWPDQPGDAGSITSGAGSVNVVEAVMAAVSDEGAFAVGADIPVKRGAEGWTWLVGHRLDVAEPPAWLVEGAAVTLDVDEARRQGLSRGHTACHLASLALDIAVADLWRKDPGADALGNPDFEGRANQTSRIHEDGSVDEYRLGKSLRKAGFDTETFAATLPERETRINAQLAAWVASGAASGIETDGPTIIDRRRWRCELPEGDAVMLCGGTHVYSLSTFGSITVGLEMRDPQTLVMTTTVPPAP